jgi:hypothetical protein
MSAVALVVEEGAIMEVAAVEVVTAEVATVEVGIVEIDIVAKGIRVTARELTTAPNEGWKSQSRVRFMQGG